MNDIDQLEKVLEKEEELASSVLQVIEEQKQALMALDAERVSQSVEKHRKLILPSAELERRRRTLVAAIAQRTPGLSRERKETRMTDLLRAHGGDTADRLKGRCDRLARAARRIQQGNQQNRLLLESTMRFVRNSIRILTNDFSRTLIDKRI